MSNIVNLLQDPNLRFVFVGGKGGVGKTTSSSAIACQMAFDRKVLLLSTDPAHSLGDAFKMKFTGDPTEVPGVPNLHVLEVNPEKFLKGEIEQWASLANSAGFDELTDKIKDFQEWLTGIPGVDEATALASVIELIESGTYDAIVFDTAPTGHTLKLLQLPDILQVGLSKLESWQTSMYNFWQMFKNMGSDATMSPHQVKKMVAERLRTYKRGIEKVGEMLKDSQHTNFVIVCIAEYLSISESRRLLEELQKHRICSKHILVNQLILQQASSSTIQEASALKEAGKLSPSSFQEIMSCAELCSARFSIQQKYLKELKSFPETSQHTIVEVPLLSSEVTGPAALLKFGNSHFVPPHFRAAKCGKLYVDAEAPLMEGDRVVIVNLTKAKDYNGKHATVMRVCEDGRVAIRIDLGGGQTKLLSLKGENVALLEESDDDTDFMGEGERTDGRPGHIHSPPGEDAPQAKRQEFI